MQGKTINGFELKSLLGKGGMAEVWYAENEINMAVAVKILSEDLSHNKAIVERFRNEAEIMVKLHHPNIRQVHGYGSIDGRPAIIMEYLEGDDLKARIKRGQRFTNDELVKWWNQLVDALNYTHKKNIVHRDIKPGNIFVDNEGNIKLLDFGIAKVRESISITMTGAMMGTLMYMSPEQVEDSKRVDYKSDIYSLAVTYVHLLTGKAPYDSTTSSDYAIRKGIVEIPLDLSNVPEEWSRFLQPYLEKKAEDRQELKHFEAMKSDQKHNTIDDDVTFVENGEDKKDKNGNNKVEHKRRIWLWVVIIVMALAIGSYVYFFNMTRPSVDEIYLDYVDSGDEIYVDYVDYDSNMYKSCKTINDYRNYIEHYGRGGKHYLEAKKKVDKHVSDSIRTLLDKEVKDAIQKYKEEHPEELDREVEEALQIYHEEEPIEEDIEQRIGDEVAKTRWEMEEEYENSEAEVAYEAVDVNLEFEVGKAEVKDSEYNKNELKKISDDLDKGREIRYIIVQDYTSPDGDEKQNIKISQDRADAAVKYIKKGLGEYANNITFQSRGMGSDWYGLAEAVINSNLTNKDEILYVIEQTDTKSLNVLKEKTPELKNLLNTLGRAVIYIIN